MMNDNEIYESLKRWYATQVYHDFNTVENKEHGKVAHEMLLFYKKSFCFWKRELKRALKDNSIKEIKGVTIEMQNRILSMETYKEICNQIDRTR